MKKVLVLFVFAVAALSAAAQVPQAFKYQAVIRDASDNVIANTSVDVRITIANSVPTNVYVETHTVTTSAFGLVNLNIGEGTPVTGTFNTIPWSTDTYTIGVEVDAGSGYEDLGASDLLSVPYALYALNSSGGGGNWTVSGNDIYNANTGNVGIGTTTPTGLLTLSSVNDVNSLYFDANGYDAHLGVYGFDLYITSYDDIRMSVNEGNSSGYFEIYDEFNSNTLFRMVNDGKAGFGTLSPITDITVIQDTFP
ncbi:MAG: hypothetical protein C0592_08780, partial [Marinilabiliales bacterium]